MKDECHPHIATVNEAQAIDEIFSNSKSIGNYSISYHPMLGYNKAREKHGNPYKEADGSSCYAYIGLRIYQHTGFCSESVYSEDLK